MKSPVRTIVLAFVANLAPAQILNAGILTVTNSSDSGPGSLRNAIAVAVNGDSIGFDPTLDGGTITLTTGHLLISGLQLTIDATSLASGISISGNHASRVFAIISDSVVTLKHLTLRNGNESAGNGGALFAAGGQLVMTDCNVINSYARYNGGGAYIGNSIQATLDRCSFRGNKGDDFGGGIFFGGTAAVTVTNTLISGNRSLNGGGILNFGANPTLVNCTIQGNSGAGVRNETTSFPTLRNTIIWGNRIGSGTINSQQIRENGTAISNVNYCLIEGRSATLQNLPANDPKFITPILVPNPATFVPTAGGDLRVYTNSPVFDLGSNAANSTNLDLSGRTRVQNVTIDPGAYEGGYVSFPFLYPSLSPSGDENLNGLSNFFEYALGINPAGPNDPSALPQMTLNGGSAFLTSTRRINAIDVQSSWVTSTNLGPLSWQAMLPGTNYVVDSTTNLSPERQQVVFQLLGTDPSRFYRQGFEMSN